MGRTGPSRPSRSGIGSPRRRWSLARSNRAARGGDRAGGARPIQQGPSGAMRSPRPGVRSPALGALPSACPNLLLQSAAPTRPDVRIWRVADQAGQGRREAVVAALHGRTRTPQRAASGAARWVRRGVEGAQSRELAAHGSHRGGEALRRLGEYRGAVSAHGDGALPPSPSHPPDQPQIFRAAPSAVNPQGVGAPRLDRRRPGAVLRLGRGGRGASQGPGRSTSPGAPRPLLGSREFEGLEMRRPCAQLAALVPCFPNFTNRH
jgi:hypothetical protein